MYTIEITKGGKEYIDYTAKNAYNDMIIVKRENPFNIISEFLPSLSFSVDENSINIAYGLNHYVIEFLFFQLYRALKALPDTEFKDMQTGIVFNQNNYKEILTAKYCSDSAVNYIITGRATDQAVKTINNENLVDIKHQDMVPIKYPILDAISRDIFYKEIFRPYINNNKPELGFFPSPLLFVDVVAKEFKVCLSWTDFIDQVFPIDFPVDYISFSFWDKAKSDVKETKFYKFEDLKKILSAPEEVSDEMLGKRLFYKGLQNEGSNYQEIFSKISEAEIENRFALDKNLYSVYTDFEI